MKAAITLILVASLVGVGYGAWQWYTTPDEIMARLTDLDMVLRQRAATMLSWWPMLLWGLIVGAIEGTEYRTRHLFGGFQRGLMRLSIPVLVVGVCLLAVSIVGLHWYASAIQLGIVALAALATFAIIAGRPVLR